MSKQRVIKRYQNRKLYDTVASTYVTLDDIAQMIKDGEDVRVVDNKTKKDLTGLTLTQIIFEEEKKQKSILPLAVLKRIIQSGGESISEFVDRHIVPGLNSLSNARLEMEKYVNKLIRRGKIEPEEGRRMISEWFSTSQKGLEDAYTRVDGHVNDLLDMLKALATLSRDVTHLEERIEELEAKLAEYEKADKS
ncbi:MAG TPA: polyhydroxyalkanoate synthesis regulator DNA-binding domain-containing protein [bacterium]|nr:polyhydroxyalkanoate synthesis regulator DNA-binding domain-containing protein [bacterium]